jgi:hypothetical protein
MSFAYESIYFDNPIQAGRVMDVFVPGKVSRDISLFFIHGGGWGAGSRDGFHKIMRGFNAESRRSSIFSEPGALPESRPNELHQCPNLPGFSPAR